MNREVSIWDKLVVEDLEPDEEAEEAEAEPTPANRITAMYRDPKWKWKRRALDLVGTIGWTYAFLKVFVFDVDRELIEELAPNAAWLVNLRFFVVMAFLAVIVVVLRPKSLLFAALYVVFFPVVVLFWKLPRALIRTRSWVAAFAVANVGTALITNLKYIVVGSTVGLISALIILATDQPALLSISAVVIAALFLVSLARTVWFSLKPSRFITMQERGIERVLDSDTMTSLTTIDDDLRSDEIEKFDPTQQQQFLLKVASSATVNRALYFWGYQLDQYRKSSAAILYSALAYVWLLTQAIAALTLVNWAVYKIDDTTFEFQDAPSLLVFARYSFSSLAGNEIGALQAHGDAANALNLAGTFVGITLFAGLVLTLALSFRRERQDAAIQQTLSRIDEIGKELEVRHKETFELSVQATLAKLEELGYVLRGMISFFASRVPPEWRPGG